jgi:hypothetical protein
MIDLNQNNRIFHRRNGIVQKLMELVYLCLWQVILWILKLRRYLEHKDWIEKKKKEYADKKDSQK